MNHIKTNGGNKIIGLWLILSITMTLALEAAPIKIMLLGDSITAGVSDTPIYPENNESNYTGDLTSSDNRIAYRGKLWDLLKEGGHDIDFVGSRSEGQNYASSAGDFDIDHEGWHGQTSKYIKEHIDDWLSINPTDIVLLHIGTNDPGNGIHIGTDNDSNQDANTTVNNVKKILNSIFIANPKTKVFVARTIEARRAYTFAIDNGNWRTATLNNNISVMISNHIQTANIKMVDLESGAGIRYDPCGTTLGDMQPYDLKGNYDFHPNEKGYKKMAQKWFDDMMASGWLSLAPIITLIGQQTVTVNIGDTYADAGASAIDVEDRNLTADINVTGSVDTTTAGTYILSYNVTDSYGRAGVEVTRTVVVDEVGKDWLVYDNNVKTATITPVNGAAQSTIMAEEIIIIPDIIGNKIRLIHTESQAYMTANKHGHVTTGFANDSTLKMGTFFKAGTKSVMKKVQGKIVISTIVTLNKDELLIIGGN